MLACLLVSDIQYRNFHWIYICKYNMMLLLLVSEYF